MSDHRPTREAAGDVPLHALGPLLPLLNLLRPGVALEELDDLQRVVVAGDGVHRIGRAAGRQPRRTGSLGSPEALLAPIVVAIAAAPHGRALRQSGLAAAVAGVRRALRDELLEGMAHLAASLGLDAEEAVDDPRVLLRPVPEEGRRREARVDDDQLPGLVPLLAEALVEERVEVLPPVAGGAHHGDEVWVPLQRRARGDPPVAPGIEVPRRQREERAGDGLPLHGLRGQLRGPRHRLPGAQLVHALPGLLLPCLGGRQANGVVLSASIRPVDGHRLTRQAIGEGRVLIRSWRCRQGLQVLRPQALAAEVVLALGAVPARPPRLLEVRTAASAKPGPSASMYARCQGVATQTSDHLGPLEPAGIGGIAVLA
mmetsp:Transcript_88457/g.263837  ORF Transcript_88457/g.263837 Transcript_88457/m.263837 type:complete len:371 (-) Transcript_88457:155-1267(-)